MTTETTPTETTPAGSIEGPESDGTARPARWQRWVPLLLVVGVVATFFPVLGNGFVWDDQANVVENEAFRGLGWDQLHWATTTTLLGHFQPLSWLTLSFDHALWGMAPAGYHLTNLLVHALGTVLFFWLAAALIRRARGGDPAHGVDAATTVGAGAAALLFALHPLRVEAVAWVTERRCLLAATFYLLALLAYLRLQDAPPGRRLRWWAATLAAFVLSLLSTAWAVTLPAVLLVLDGYPLRRLDRGATARVLLEKVPFLVLAVAGAVVAALAQRETGAAASLTGLGLLDRTLLAGSALWFYLAKTLVPLDLSPLYLIRADELGDAAHVAALVAAVGVTIGLVALARRRPALAATWLACGLLLAPVLGFAQSGLQAAADRYTYLGMWPWATLAGGGLAALWARGRRTLVAAVALPPLLALAALAHAQTAVWRDGEALWTRAIEADPRNHVAFANRADDRRAAGRLVEAERDASEAIRLAPGFEGGYRNRGTIRLALGDLAGAEGDFDRAAAESPDDPRVLCNRGVIRQQRGDLDGARRDYDAALAHAPGDAACLANLGLLLEQQGRRDEALAAYDAAIRADPRAVAGPANRGRLRLARGDLVGALADFDRALALGPPLPDRARLHASRGAARAQGGDAAGARDDFDAALAIDPSLLDAYVMRARLAAAAGDRDGARRDLREALDRAPADWPRRPLVERLLGP